MPLVRTTLEQELLSIFSNVNREVTPETAAKDLATVIDNYIKTAHVEINIPIPVTTPSGPGSITTPVTGKLK